MDRQTSVERLMNGMNVLILAMIALIYVVTGTPLGEDAISAFARRTVYRGAREGAVAVECLVTWDAENLSDMLDTLREKDVQITFFVSGRWARAHASTLRRMAEDGHEIGNCGYAPTLDGGADVVEKDIAAAAGAIGSVTGRRPALYCSGLRDRSVSARASANLGMTHVAASADLLSGRGEAEDVLARASDQLFDGSILLIQPTAAAAGALPALLDLILARGYRPTTVSRVLKGNG